MQHHKTIGSQFHNQQQQLQNRTNAEEEEEDMSHLRAQFSSYRFASLFTSHLCSFTVDVDVVVAFVFPKKEKRNKKKPNGKKTSRWWNPLILSHSLCQADDKNLLRKVLQFPKWMKDLPNCAFKQISGASILCVLWRYSFQNPFSNPVLSTKAGED